MLFRLFLVPGFQCVLAARIEHRHAVPIVDLATGSAGTAINHVGILYAILGVIVPRPEDLDANAAGGDSWFVAVRAKQIPHGK